MTIPKESSRSKTGQKLCQVVTQAKRKSKKDITLQGDSAEQLKTINKSLLEKLTIFSEKEKKSEDEIIGDMVASELKDLFCSILKVNFKQKVNNLIFKYQPLNVQQNAQLYSPIQPLRYWFNSTIHKVFQIFSKFVRCNFSPATFWKFHPLYATILPNLWPPFSFFNFTIHQFDIFWL